MAPRNPRQTLTEIMSKYFPEVPGLFNPPITSLVTQLRFNFHRYDTPEALSTPETAVGVWEEVISIFNNYIEFVENDLVLLTQFFCKFPNYFFTLGIELQKILLPRLADYYIEKSLEKIKSAGIDVPNLLYMVLPALSKEQGAELARFYVDLHKNDYEENDAHKIKSVGIALLELREFLNQTDLKRYTEFLIDKLLSKDWETVVQNLVNISFKLTPTQVQLIVRHLCSKSFSGAETLHLHGLIRCLINARCEEGKPVIITDVVIELITKIKQESNSPTFNEIEFHNSLKVIKYNLSDDAIKTLADMFIVEFNFQALHNFFDVLSLEQRRKTANCYLNWIQSTKPKYDQHGKKTKAIEHIQIFKEYFDESLNHCVEELIRSDKLNLSSTKDLILYLCDLMPHILQRKIIFIFLAELSAINKDWIYKDFYIVVHCLECLKENELPDAMQIVFKAVESRDISIEFIWKLKKFAVKKGIDIEHYLGKLLEQLYEKIKIPNANEYYPNDSSYRSLYASLGSTKREDLLIKKYCIALQNKARFQDGDSKTIEQIIWLLVSFYNISDASKLLISETVKIYFDNYEVGKHPIFSDFCRYISQFNLHQDNNVLGTLFLENYFNFIFSITAQEELIVSDFYAIYLRNLYAGVGELHGHSINDPILKHITNRIHLGLNTINPGENKTALELTLENKRMNEYSAIFDLVTKLVSKLEPGVNRLKLLPLALEIIINVNPNPQLKKNCSNLIKAIFANQTMEESKCIREFIVIASGNPELNVNQTEQLRTLAISYFMYSAYTDLYQEKLSVIDLVENRPDLAELKIIFKYAEKSQKDAILEQTTLIPELADKVISNLRLA